MSNRLVVVEAAAALAQAARGGRLTPADHLRSRELLDDIWAELDLVDVDNALVREAAALTERFALRGYDTVHCASAAQLADDDLVAAASDKQLLRAWSELGIAKYDPDHAV